MLKKILKLKTEDYKRKFRTIHNGDFLIIKAHNISVQDETSFRKEKLLSDDDSVKRSQDNSDSISRFGIIISKKISNKAVVRNYYKRLLYSIIENKLKENSEEFKDDNETIDTLSTLYIIQLKKPFEKNSFEIIKEELNFIFKI